MQGTCNTISHHFLRLSAEHYLMDRLGMKTIGISKAQSFGHDQQEPAFLPQRASLTKLCQSSSLLQSSVLRIPPARYLHDAELYRTVSQHIMMLSFYQARM